MSLPSRLIVNVSVADVRKAPAHESEMVTQALLGWPLRVLGQAEEGRWFDVRLPDGYRGWVRSWLTAPARPGWPGPLLAEVDAPVSWLRAAPEAASEPVSDIVIGTRLPPLPGRAPGWVLLALPDGRAGWLPRADLLRRTPGPAEAPRRPPTAAAVLRSARRFLGVPYVWGGRSSKGLDCSGFTQMILDLHDVRIPRDAKDQRAALERRARGRREFEGAAPGSLVFFGPKSGKTTHVGFATGGGGLLHAQGRVRLDSLDPVNPMFRKDLWELFQVVCPVPALKARA